MQTEHLQGHTLTHSPALRATSPAISPCGIIHAEDGLVWESVFIFYVMPSCHYMLSATEAFSQFSILHLPEGGGFLSDLPHKDINSNEQAIRLTEKQNSASQGLKPKPVQYGIIFIDQSYSKSVPTIIFCAAVQLIPLWTNKLKFRGICFDLLNHLQLC